MREEILRQIHEGHQGIEKRKIRARSIMYWPVITQKIEDTVSRCWICEKYQKQNCKEMKYLADHGKQGKLPEQAMQSRNIRTKLPTTEEQLPPKVEKDIQHKKQLYQEKTKLHHDRHAKNLSDLEVGQSVLIRQGKEWSTNSPPEYNPDFDPIIPKIINNNKVQSQDVEKGSKVLCSRLGHDSLMEFCGRKVKYHSGCGPHEADIGESRAKTLCDYSPAVGPVPELNGNGEASKGRRNNGTEEPQPTSEPTGNDEKNSYFKKWVFKEKLLP
ncbi:hypothetical protein ILUMI_20588 [Ignelater luminosus]|uniref:RNA-directed DNA polymerase n=1 Tax=Ignelater luminosus TaxID=2038154 RepID=A0A8K0FYS5_IGNLU|nr:hypothetical protein ILUMI_20588 [Ignelater luminosus]